MTQPHATLKTALKLRLVSLLAFPAGAALMAVYQRSPLALAVLAAVMLGVSLFERRRLAAVAGAQAMMTGASLLGGFGFRLGLLIGIFVLTLGTLALFRDTSLARVFSGVDLALIALPAGVALAANEISARIARREFSGLQTQLSAGFGAPGGPAQEGGEIIEGEIIGEDEPPGRG